MAESSSSCHMQPNSYSTWMIATAVSSSYCISGPTCNHLLANLAPSRTLMHPQHPPRHFGLQVGLSIQVGSLNIDLGRCGKNLGCNLSHAMNNIDPEWWTSVHMECHGIPWNAMECGTPRALIQQGPLGESSFCATFLSFLSGFQIFQIFHLHVTWTSQPIQMSRMAHDDVWHHIWLKGILW